MILLVDQIAIRDHTQTSLPFQDKGHDTRWILSICVLVTQLLAFLEGLVTDENGSSADDERHSMMMIYVPSLCALLGGVVSTRLRHHMEKLQIRGPYTVLLTYWILACGAECVRLVDFVTTRLNDDGTALRYYLIILLLCLYGILFCADGCHVFRSTRNKVIPLFYLWFILVSFHVLDGIGTPRF